MVVSAAWGGLGTKRPALHAMQRVAVPIPEGLPHPGPNGIAVRVGFQGAERLYRAGAVLDCQPLPADQGPVPTGTRIVLQREANRDQKVEIPVREVALDGEHARLWPRSTHPEHQTPIRTRWPAHGTFRADGRTMAMILGRVLASWQPEPGATAT